MRLAVALALALVVPPATPALAADTGTIEGQITIQEAAPAPPAKDQVPFSDVVVYLNGFAPGTTFPPPADEASLIQRKKRFVPYILPIQVGTTVRFPNEDDVFHNVFSPPGDQSFNIGRYPKGPGKIHVFSKVGHVRVYCDIHSIMKAHILVLPSPHFTFPDRTGRYRLDGAPTGSYWVVSWHDRLKKPEQKPVTVAAGQTAKVDLTIR